MTKIFFISLVTIFGAFCPAFAYQNYSHHPYAYPAQPYYYVPGYPVPPLANPFTYFRGAVCYAQSYNGLVFWGGGPSMQQANYNAQNICVYNTGYACYFAGCRWL